MADLAVQDISDEDGAEISFAAASAGGDKFIHSDRAFIVIKNLDASSKTVTVTAQTTTVNDASRGELTRSNIALVVPAAGTGIIPPLPSLFRNPSDLNKVALTYSAVTSLSVAVVRIE